MASLPTQAETAQMSYPQEGAPFVVGGQNTNSMAYPHNGEPFVANMRGVIASGGKAPTVVIDGIGQGSVSFIGGKGDFNEEISGAFHDPLVYEAQKGYAEDIS